MDAESVNIKSNRLLLIVAWIVMLVVSLLPKVILQEILHQQVNSFVRFSFTLIFLLIMLALTYFWKTINLLRPYFIVFMVLFVAEWFFYDRLGAVPGIKEWLNSPYFFQYMMSTQVLRMGVTLVMIAALLVLKKKRSAFFLVKGQLDAPVEPVRWLGISAGSGWKRFGRILSIVISLGTLTFLVIAAIPALTSQAKNGVLGGILLGLLEMMPFVLLFAAMNAFSEEITYKASFISVLEDVVGDRQALYIMAAFFGLGHFYGVPYGIVGVLMATFLGWILGKSMLETKGSLWAWFIHFLQDVLIFTFMAMGSVTAGGK
jgi:uncharacterized protein